MSKSEITLSMEAASLKCGKYEHYRGRKYQVLGVAAHSETLEELVVYKALYGSMLTWVRPLSMFLEEVDVEGESTPRFKFVGL